MKYSKEKIKQCYDWVVENGLQEYGGASMKDFCEAMDIDDMTYYSWMQKSEFSEAIKNAKDVFRSTLEVKVVNSLAKVAQGYEWTETSTDLRPDSEGRPTVRGQRKVNRHVPPNVGAAIFLLTNLNGEEWKNKQTQDLAVKAVDVPTEEEIEANLERLRKLREESEE